MIGQRAAQGQGLGTRFASLIHAFAFDQLQLQHLFVSIVAENVPSRRLFERLGYCADSSDDALTISTAVLTRLGAIWRTACGTST